ncbi:MAG: type VI secretion system contractile sheath large subunit [Acetobacteraceae bacterium]|nr:type VI secretion system contractile sheath large subunit [Acetobacteraceae bacterium]
MSALREAALAGAFFGTRHADTAERLAAFAGLGAHDALRAWFGDAAALLAARPDALRGALDRDIAAIDALIGAQLDAILHHPRMARLEGSWRGLAWLADGIEPASRVRVKVLNIAWSDLCRDLERAAEFDQSHLFRKIYEEEFGMPGGEPYGLLVIDHEARHRPAPGHPTDDVAAIAALAGIAAAAFAPTVLAAAPALLQTDAFTDLALATDLSDPFRGPEYARWRAVAGREDMRFVAIAMPRVLARPPWEDDPARADGFRYAETALHAGERVWMGAGYAFAAVAARAFAQSAWPADVRGTDLDRVGGGLVTDLPLEPFRTDPDQVCVRPSLEIALTDRQERALVEAGLMPLGALPFGEEAAFGAVRSVQALPRLAGPAADGPAQANARLSAQLNAILCASRFAHYVKVMGRDMVGKFRTADEIERQLQAWLSSYVNASLTAGPESRARFPLVAARATVREKAGRPGVFGCVIQLQPHYQLDNVAGSFRLVTDIAGAQ